MPFALATDKKPRKLGNGRAATGSLAGFKLASTWSEAKELGKENVMG